MIKLLELLTDGDRARLAPMIANLGCRFRRKPAGYSDLMSATIPI